MAMTTLQAIKDNESPRPDAGSPAIERRVLTGLKSGDPGTFALILERYEHSIYRFFYFSHGHHDEAEDQCAETFVALVQAAGRLRNQEIELRPYLYGIARNVLRRSRRRARPLEITDEELEQIVAPERSPRDSAALRQEYRRAMAVLDSFPEPARQVLMLRFIEELPLEEIGRILDLPLNTVKSHVHRGREKLRQLLGPAAGSNEEKNHE